MKRGLRRAGEVVTVLRVASVGKGRGRAASSTAASHTAIGPGPRLAHVAYGISVTTRVARTMASSLSRDSATAGAVTTCTPPSSEGRNSLASTASSGNTTLRTSPSLSGHSAA